jgi:hypothetical protein
VGVLRIASQRLIVGISGASALPMALRCESADRFHFVVEVDDVEAARCCISVPTFSPQTTFWGVKLFQRHPEGVLVTFLEWDNPRSDQT